MKNKSTSTRQKKDKSPRCAVASCSAAVLWSQALCNDYYHAIPVEDHDPNATGWIALCGSFCCGTPLMAEETEGREACKTCLHFSSPNVEISHDRERKI